MAILATIAKPEYNNVITANPSGSAYAYSASTGVLDANFAGTIGTTDSIQILTQGYQFAWKPDTVNVLDDQGNLTLLDNVNANATAQVWNNKITYVGTTAATSDEFVVEGNQLKHSVRMVAPPTLPSGFTGKAQYLAIGGDIGTTAQDWANVDLYADGVSHRTDFITSDDLSFVEIASGKEIYRIPKITVTDDAGNEVNGQYKLVFGVNNVVTLYMLCPWSWMQSAVYPIIIDPTVIVSSAYDTSGNGGRKFVRLSNNWIITSAANSNVVYFYVSKDDGQTWAQLCTYNVGATPSWAIASIGTIVYVVATSASGTLAIYTAFDATTVTNTQQSNLATVDTQTSFGAGVTLEVDANGNLVAGYCAKNSTYANCFNIRYSRGTVSGTTATWSTPVQVTTYNTTGQNVQNPCVMINPSNNPVFLGILYNSPLYLVISCTYSGSWSVHTAYVVSSGSYVQANPCGVYDNNGLIRAVWHGYDATFTNTYQIKYATSSDNGATWSSAINLTSVSASGQHQQNATMTISPNTDDLYVFLQGINAVTSSSYFNIRMIKYSAQSASWGNITDITTNTTNNAQNPQTLWSQYNMNSSDEVRMIYSDAQANAVEYYSIPLDNPPYAPILNPVANFDATTSQTFSWTFSDPDPSDSQSAFQLQILDTSTGTTVVDTGKTASTTSNYTLPASTLPNGKQYQWRVQTWDSQGAQGTYSAYSTFSTAAEPTVSITSPTSGGTVPTSSVTVSWSYSDPANNAQQSFDVQLLDSTDATVLADSGTVTSSGNQYTIQYTLTNSTTYHVKVTATNSQGITSSAADVSFSTSFTPPAQATTTATQDSTNARIVVNIVNPTPSGTEPAVAYNDIYRRNNGDTTWTRIATNVPVGNSTTPTVYYDYATASGQGYDYKITSIGNNGTQIDSTIISDIAIHLTNTGLWVHDVNDPAGTVLNLQYYNASTQSADGSVPQNRQWTPSSTSMQFAGRDRPVIEFGEQDTFQLSYKNVVMLSTDAQWPLLEDLIRVNKSTLCFRDGRGTMIFGCVLGYTETDLVFGNMVDLTLQQTAYSLTV